jgi:hypothetical protein
MSDDRRMPSRAAWVITVLVVVLSLATLIGMLTALLT